MKKWREGGREGGTGDEGREGEEGVRRKGGRGGTEGGKEGGREGGRGGRGWREGGEGGRMDGGSEGGRRDLVGNVHEHLARKEHQGGRNLLVMGLRFPYKGVTTPFRFLFGSAGGLGRDLFGDLHEHLAREERPVVPQVPERHELPTDRTSEQFMVKPKALVGLHSQTDRESK